MRLARLFVFFPDATLLPILPINGTLFGQGIADASLGSIYITLQTSDSQIFMAASTPPATRRGS